MNKEQIDLVNEMTMLKMEKNNGYIKWKTKLTKILCNHFYCSDSNDNIYPKCKKWNHVDKCEASRIIDKLED